MRILVLMPDTLEKPTGGLGVQLNHFIKHLPDITFDVVGQPQTNSDLYTSVSNALPNIEHASLITATGQIQYFAEAIKRPKPDIVHAYDWSTYFAGYYTAKHFNVPLVVTMQLSVNLLNNVGIAYSADPNSIDGYWINRVHCEMELFGLNNANRIIQVSNAMASRFKGLEKITHIIPNGIDLEDWTPKKKIGLKSKSIVYIGRFAAMKNIQALVKAEIPDGIHLYFVGNEKGGEMFGEVKKFAEANPDKVTYYGEAFGQDKVDLLSSADGVIIPSINEPFGIVGLEGLASKSIVLSSWVDGLSDFLNKDNSIYCGTTPESIENAYARFLLLTDKEKENMIANGIETCKQYSWVNSTKKIKEVYKNMV